MAGAGGSSSSGIGGLGACAGTSCSMAIGPGTCACGGGGRCVKGCNASTTRGGNGGGGCYGCGGTAGCRRGGGGYCGAGMVNTLVFRTFLSSIAAPCLNVSALPITRKRLRQVGRILKKSE